MTVAAKWYVVNVQSGLEKKVATTIREQAEKKGLVIDEVLVPTEKIVEMKRGKKIDAERKLLPSYILVRMELTDDSWHLVKTTPKVLGFLGVGGKPQAISQSEADRIMNAVVEGAEKAKPSVSYEVGEQVRVVDGPFNSFNGTVEEVDEEKSRLKVAVSIFGRATPVELEYTQVEKV